jgi:hypothetical protein
MSNYNNFVSDFPARCAALLEDFERTARLRKREVTLMLCVAMPSIVIPWERLAGPRSEGQSPGHPSRDWERFDQAKSALDDLCEAPFQGSPIWPDSSSRSWFFGELADVSNGPDSWAELRTPKPLGPDKKARTVLLHIRNALAHGNIFTRGNPEIEQIILLSRPQGATRFRFLAVDPAEFRAFLRNWLEFLRDLKLPDDVVSRHAEKTAYDHEAAPGA